MPSARVTRGRATQNLVAEWLRKHGAPDAKSRPASLPGTDIYDCGAIAPEVKARADESYTMWLKQAQHNAGGLLPLVVYRPNGYGPERIAHWVVAFTLADATWLLQQAGLLNPTVSKRQDLYR